MQDRTSGEKLKLLRKMLKCTQDEFHGEFSRSYLARLEKDKEILTPTAAKYYIKRFNEMAKERNLAFKIEKDYFDNELTKIVNDLVKVIKKAGIKEFKDIMIETKHFVRDYHKELKHEEMCKICNSVIDKIVYFIDNNTI